MIKEKRQYFPRLSCATLDSFMLPHAIHTLVLDHVPHSISSSKAMPACKEIILALKGRLDHVQLLFT